jgi:hypothetical protein
MQITQCFSSDAMISFMEKISFNSPSKQFIEAASKGNITKLKQLLDNQKVTIDVVHNDHTALGKAILSHQVEAVQFLVYTGADVNKESKYNFLGNKELPLTMAIKKLEKYDDLRICTVLLTAANIVPHRRMPALREAIRLPHNKAVDLLLAYGVHTYNYANPKIIDNEQILSSLTLHTNLQQQALNPTRDFFTSVINKGYFGLVKQAIQNGIQPIMEDLQLAKSQYLKLQAVAKDNESIDGSTNPFTLRDKEIYTQTYREMGKLLIKYLRITDGVGCKTYPSLYKNGLKSALPLIPQEIIRNIAWFVVN